MAPKPLTPAQLSALFRDKLASSKLDARDAARLKLSAQPATVIAKAGYKPFAAMRIPYFDEAGDPVDFERVRYLEDTRSSFDKLTNVKERRYDQLANTGTEVYLPPLMKEDWGFVLLDTEAELIITEGELKAASATKAGFPTIGLGGVWNFTNSASKTELLPRLEIARWEKRSVLIVFDSDAASNINIVKAENRLSRYLLERGAEVFIARLPNVYEDGSKKTGLDDFLLMRSKEELRALLANNREPYAPSKALHELNERIVVVHREKTIVELSTMLRMSVRDFTDLSYAKHKIARINKDGEEILVPIAPIWLRWDHRHELSRTTYAPAKPQEHDGQLNTWTGWGRGPIEGDVTPWLELLDYMFSTDDTFQDWFVKWLAYPLQYPGTKLHTACFFWGPQGTGKTFLGDIMNVIYGDNGTTIGNHHITMSHNTWAQGKQFIVANEISTPEDRLDVSFTMKEMITRGTVRINPKFVNEYEIPDCINYFITSNPPNGIVLEEDDRRYFVHRAPKIKQSDAFFDKLRLWKDGDGPAALFDYLLKVDCSGFNPNARAPLTSARGEVLSHGRSVMADWAYSLVNDPDSVLRAGKTTQPQCLYSAEELFGLFVEQRCAGNAGRYNVLALGRELRAAGATPANNNVQVRTASGPKRLWIARETEKLSVLTGAQLGEYYDNERRTGRAALVSAKQRKF